MVLAKETLEHIATAQQLKSDLVNYYKKREQKYKPIILTRYAKNHALREDVMANGIDWLIHCFRFQKGDTLIDRFIKKHRALSGLEIQILERWKDSFEGIFEVKALEADSVRLFNLVDQQEYTAASITGPETLERLKPGGLVMSRLIPLDDIYLFSGNMYLLPPGDKKALQDLAAKIAQSNSSAKYDQAWEIQRKYRDSFISYFGDDLITLPGHKLDEAFDNFNHYHIEKTLHNMPEEKKSEYPAAAPKMEFPEALTRNDNVGLIFDEREGLNFYPGFESFMAPFKNPRLLEDEEHREVITGYLESDSISTLPFRKMVERYPESSRQAFAALFAKPNWDNDKDFHELMEKHKGAFLKKKWEPATLPFNMI
ncbi:hypothetical protein Psch_02953 [Pelotomaculum schinkii]|uniref:Uncharacterized protein n=1 Tax=Pelotomaculum schinkii TaxID=78350 RepID=A0A4Y7RB40_9FIRM|nr:hypothetical protein [Pelotomaculum schinkii]TEB05911.1 hypothetical protein Psch_02953 [Pelotomaculum schinkii]